MEEHKMIEIKLETAKAALQVFDVLKSLTKDHPLSPYKESISKHLNDLKRAIENTNG